MQNQHTDEAVTWDFMAKRELEATVTPELQTAKGKASDTDRKEERCCAVYEEGVKNLNTGRRSPPLPRGLLAAQLCTTSV